MSKCPMRGHFRYLRFKTFPMTPRTPQCDVFQVLLSSSEHSRVPEDSKSPTFPSVGLHPHTWPSQGCDISQSLYCGYHCLMNTPPHGDLQNANICIYCQSVQSVPTTMKTFKSRRCLLLEQHSHIYIHIFVQTFFLDKTHPNLIVGIDALNKLHQM